MSINYPQGLLLLLLVSEQGRGGSSRALRSLGCTLVYVGH